MGVSDIQLCGACCMPGASLPSQCQRGQADIQSVGAACHLALQLGCGELALDVLRALAAAAAVGGNGQRGGV